MPSEWANMMRMVKPETDQSSDLDFKGRSGCAFCCCFLYIYSVNHAGLQLVRTQPLHKDSINKSCWGLQEQRLNVGTTQTVLLHESAAAILYFEGEKLWVLSHPPCSYSPDLAPHDLWMFFYFENWLCTCRKSVSATSRLCRSSKFTTSCNTYFGQTGVPQHLPKMSEGNATLHGL